MNYDIYIENLCFCQKSKKVITWSDESSVIQKITAIMIQSKQLLSSITHKNSISLPEGLKLKPKGKLFFNWIFILNSIWKQTVYTVVVNIKYIANKIAFVKSKYSWNK